MNEEKLIEKEYAIPTYKIKEFTKTQPLVIHDDEDTVSITFVGYEQSVNAIVEQISKNSSFLEKQIFHHAKKCFLKEFPNVNSDSQFKKHQEDFVSFFTTVQETSFVLAVKMPNGTVVKIKIKSNHGYSSIIDAFPELF